MTQGIKLLDASREKLTERGAFEGIRNPIVEKLASTLGDDIPDSMKRQIAIFGITSLMSGKWIRGALSEDDNFPVASVHFILAHSGAKKTSSMTTIFKALKGGFDYIENVRTQIKELKEKQIGETLPKLEPYQITPSTITGIIRVLNQFKREGIGIPSLFADEIATELEGNPDIITNIQLVSQLFDNGNFDPKVLKDVKQQSDKVTDMAMPAMFMGSEHSIVEDDIIQKKFINEFMSKLARRSFFCYPQFNVAQKVIENYEEHSIQKEEDAMRREEIAREFSKYSEEVLDFLYQNDIATIPFDSDAKRMINYYSDYCEEMSIELLDDMQATEQKHRHWKTTKIAVAIAAMSKQTIVTEMIVCQAITYAEDLKSDIDTFIYKIQRKPHEKLCDLIIETGAPLSFHELLKKNLISKVDEVHDLIVLANATARFNGTIEIQGSEVIGRPFVSSDAMIVSGTPTKNYDALYEQNLELFPNLDEKSCSRRAKTEIAEDCSNAVMQVAEYTFEECANFLSRDLAFCNTEFEHGKRGLNNIIGYTNLIILDIDKSDLTDEDAHLALTGYNHHIARTSNVNNPYKFRVLLKSDIMIDLKTHDYKTLIKNIGELIGLTPDDFGRDQLIYGYNGREVMSELDGDDLEVSKLMQKSVELPKDFKPGKKTSKQLESIYNNRRKMFHYAYELQRGGQGIHSKLYMLFRHLVNLGFNYQMNEEIFTEIVASGASPRPGWLDGINRLRKRTYGKD